MGTRLASDVDPYCDEFLAEPWDDLTLLRDAGPAVRLDRYDVWAIARHHDVMAALRDHETYSSSHGVGLADLADGGSWRRPSILVEADPPEHTRNRKVVAGTMTPKALRSLEGAFADAAARIVDELLDRRTFDGVHDLAEPFPTEVFPRAFGIEVTDETRRRLLDYGSLVFNGNGVENDRFRAVRHPPVRCRERPDADREPRLRVHRTGPLRDDPEPGDHGDVHARTLTSPVPRAADAHGIETVPCPASPAKLPGRRPDSSVGRATHS